MNRYRTASWCLAAALLAAAAVNYVPALKDADGRVLGLFNLNAYQDGLHIASAAWAAASAAISRRASLLFLRTFGAIYLLDGIVGVTTGSSFLDLSLFIEGVRDTPAMTNFLSSVPHLALGATGVAVGWSRPRAEAAA